VFEGGGVHAGLLVFKRAVSYPGGGSPPPPSGRRLVGSSLGKPAKI